MRRGGASALCWASASKAIQAYSAFAEIFIGPLASMAPRAGNSKLAAVQRMQPALGLGLSRPPTRAFVLSIDHGLGTGPAANRGIPPIVQRVVGDAIGHDEGPNVAAGPVQEGVDLHEAELGVPANHLRLRSIRRLVCPDRRDPRVVAHERSPQWNDLSLVAALLVVRYVERPTVQAFILPHRRVRPHHLYLDPVAIGELVPQRQGLGKLVARVQVKDADTGLNLGQEMNQDTAFRTKRGRHRQPRKESLDGPPQNLRGRRLNEQFVDFRQLFLGQHRFSPGHGVRAPQIVEPGPSLHFLVMKVNIMAREDSGSARANSAGRAWLAAAVKSGG